MKKSLFIFAAASILFAGCDKNPGGAGDPEAKIAGIISGIQSVEVVPTDTDGAVEFTADGASAMLFDVSPLSAAQALLAETGAQSYFSLQTENVDTSGSPIFFDIISVQMDASGNFVEVTVMPKDDSVISRSYVARLKIEANTGKDNYVCRTSGDFSLVCSSKLPQFLSFCNPVVEWTIGDTYKIGALNKPQMASGAQTTVQYYSDNESVAMILGNEIFITGTGRTTITVCACETEKYFAGTASYQLVIFPQDALKGVFSVSEAKTVLFSKGNLRASIDAGGLPVGWGFAEHQYDFVGKSGANEKIGVAAGDFDLFGWSTDAEHSNWGINTQTVSLSGYTDGNFKEWGLAVGGNWRTLSIQEWTYLLHRNVNGGSKEGYAYRNCNSPGIEIEGDNVKGTFIYPDNYEGSYNESTWSAIEEAQIVFLPAAGFRDGNSIFAQEDMAAGYYWTSTASDDICTYYLGFLGSGDADQWDINSRELGYSVRLVSDFN